MSIDLTGPRAVMDQVFDDEGTRCVITGDPEGGDDDIFDEDTLALTQPSGDETTLYTGPCLARPVQGFGQTQRTEGGQHQYIETWRLRLPTSAPLLPLGAKVTFTAAPNDTTLLTRTFHITERRGGSLSVSRIFMMIERATGPRT